MHTGLYENPAKVTGQCSSISDPRGKPGPCDSTHVPAKQQTLWSHDISLLLSWSHKIFLWGNAITTAAPRRVWLLNAKQSECNRPKICTSKHRIKPGTPFVKWSKAIMMSSYIHGTDTVSNPFDRSCLNSSTTSQRTQTQSIRKDNWLMSYKGLISAVQCEDQTIQTWWKTAVS